MRTNGRTKVLVAVDPICLRSALSAALAADPRLDIVALPSGSSIEQVANEFDVVLASEAPVASDTPLVVISRCGRTLEVNGTAPQTLPYEGLRSLADLLYARPRITNLRRSGDTHFFVTPVGGTPESETDGSVSITPIGLPASPIWGRRAPHLGGRVPPK